MPSTLARRSLTERMVFASGLIIKGASWGGAKGLANKINLGSRPELNFSGRRNYDFRLGWGLANGIF